MNTFISFRENWYLYYVDSSNPRTLYASHLFISSLMSFMSLCSVQPISPVHVLVRFTPEYLVFEQLKWYCILNFDVLLVFLLVNRNTTNFCMFILFQRYCWTCLLIIGVVCVCVDSSGFSTIMLTAKRNSFISPSSFVWLLFPFLALLQWPQLPLPC